VSLPSLKSSVNTWAGAAGERQAATASAARSRGGRKSGRVARDHDMRGLLVRDGPPGPDTPPDAERPTAQTLPRGVGRGNEDGRGLAEDGGKTEGRGAGRSPGLRKQSGGPVPLAAIVPNWAQSFRLLLTAGRGRGYSPWYGRAIRRRPHHSESTADARPRG